MLHWLLTISPPVRIESTRGQFWQYWARHTCVLSSYAWFSLHLINATFQTPLYMELTGKNTGWLPFPPPGVLLNHRLDLSLCISCIGRQIFTPLSHQPLHLISDQHVGKLTLPTPSSHQSTASSNFMMFLQSPSKNLMVDSVSTGLPLWLS